MIKTSGQIYSRKGIKGFYVGYQPYLIYTMTNWGCYFCLFESIKKEINGKNKDFWASLIAGIVNVLLVTPLSVVANMIISIEKRKNV